MVRVTIDDLRFAQDWLSGYEPSPNDPNGGAAERVRAWLQAEIDRRENDITIRGAAKQLGIPEAALRAKIAARRAVPQ